MLRAAGDDGQLDPESAALADEDPGAALDAVGLTPAQRHTLLSAFPELRSLKR